MEGQAEGGNDMSEENAKYGTNGKKPKPHLPTTQEELEFWKKNKWNLKFDPNRGREQFIVGYWAKIDTETVHDVFEIIANYCRARKLICVSMEDGRCNFLHEDGSCYFTRRSKPGLCGRDKNGKELQGQNKDYSGKGNDD